MAEWKDHIASAVSTTFGPSAGDGEVDLRSPTWKQELRNKYNQGDAQVRMLEGIRPWVFPVAAAAGALVMHFWGKGKKK